MATEAAEAPQQVIQEQPQRQVFMIRKTLEVPQAQIIDKVDGPVVS